MTRPNWEVELRAAVDRHPMSVEQVEALILEHHSKIIPQKAADLLEALDRIRWLRESPVGR